METKLDEMFKSGFIREIIEKIKKYLLNIKLFKKHTQKTTFIFVN